MDRVADVVLCCLRRVKLMDVPTITNNALSVRNMEIAGYFVDSHLSIHSASLTIVDCDELVGALTNTLS